MAVMISIIKTGVCMKLFIIIISITLFVSCQLNNKKTKVISFVSKNECLIYSTIVNDNNYSFINKRAKMIIESDTVDFRKIVKHFSEKSSFVEKMSNFKFANKKIRITKEMAKSFIKNNLTRFKIKNCFENSKVLLVPSQKIKMIFKDNSFISFYKKFPGSRGYSSFSRVGFNNKNNEAMVYFQSFASTTGAGGSIIYLKTVNGKWKIVGSNPIWNW